MSSSAAIRKQIETDFQDRYPSVLTPAARTIRETARSGIFEIDALLNGGLPVGAISEITGSVSSGRTNIALSFLARRIEDGSVCAWIDAGDALDPESAAANGVSLEHLLWVRCRTQTIAVPFSTIRNTRTDKKQHWTRLDQAIRAADLLLQAGGFAAIVLDLADEAIEHCSRIPLATWFRFRQAADRTRCSLIVLGKAAYAQSSAAVVLACQPDSMDTAGGTVIRGFNYRVSRGRERFSPISTHNRKPPATSWSSYAQWDRVRRA